MSNSSIFKITATTQGFKKAQGEVKGLTGSMKKFAIGLVSVATAYRAFGEAIDSIKLAGRLEGVETAFNNMRKEAGFSINTFNKLDEALNGTADRLTIMEQANNAMLLGIAESEDQMAEMFDVAQRLAQALGQDARFGIESLVTGLGRQSKLMLDNLGIMVDVEAANKTYAEALGKSTAKLTDQERKQAFINEAMRQGKELVNGIGEETLTTAQKLEKFTTSITNFKTAIGQALIDSGVLGELTTFTDVLAKMAKEYSDARAAEASLTETEKKLNAELALSKERQEELRTLRKEINILSNEEEKSKLSLVDATLMERRVNQEIIRQGGDLNTLRGAIKIELEAIANRIMSVNAELQVEKNLKEEKIQFDEQELALLTAKNNAKEIELNQKVRDIDLTKKFTQLQQEQKRSVFDPSRVQDYNDLVTDSVSISVGAIRDIGKATNAGAKTMEALTIAAAIADTYAGANKALAAGVPPFNYIAAAGVVAAGLANVQTIRQSYSRKQGQTGFEGVVDEPTQFTVGEGGAAEYVSVTPMEGVNNAGGQGMTINISGNVMSQDFIENELSEGIAEAIRKGISFA